MNAVAPAVKTPKKTGFIRVVLILIGVLIGICLICIVGSLAMQSLGLIPTLTPSSTPTITPTSTQTPLATGTPEPTQTLTPQPTIDAYMLELYVYFLKYQDAYQGFSDQHMLAANDTSLIFDNNWRLEMGSKLAELKSAAADLGSIDDVPDKYSHLDQLMKQIAAETDLLISNYTQGIDNLDSTLIEASGENMKNIADLLNESALEMQELQ